MELAGISLTESDGQIFLRGVPAAERAPLDLETLRAYLEHAGYAECVFLDDAIEQAVQDCNSKTTPFAIQVAQRNDAQIVVLVSADHMEAQISVTPPRGGREAQVEDMVRALSGAGVIFGISQEALRALCDSRASDRTSVAFGMPAVNGVDAIFEELLPQTASRAPRTDANGFIDYREHGAIALVEPGARLMRRTPARPGTTGYDVLGHAIEPVPGHDDPFAFGLSGVEVDGEDPNMLKAAITGQPVLVACGVEVEPVLRVANVNLETGNIYFDGCVQVDGDVIQGMKVQACGDITVAGTVEGGLLEAVGNILVKGGIIAQSNVRAGGAINARFAEGSTIHAGISIVLDDMALECELDSLNQIIIGSKVPQRGKLVGGCATAMMLVSAPVLGSDRSGQTRVVVGANPELEKQMQELLERLHKEKANEENLDKLIQHLTKAGDPKGVLEKVRASRRLALKVWGDLLVQRSELEKQIALTRNARVDVGVTTSGAVELKFGSRTTRLRKIYGRGSFSVDTQARLVFTDPQGQATPLA